MPDTEPTPLQFAYWVPNVSGGLVVSDIEQRTDWSYDYNRRLAVLAKLVATADHISGGRAAVNVVSGWFKGEFTALGEPWLEHDERYRRSEEFIRVLRASWTTDDAQFAGDFYRLRGFDLKPKPLSGPDRPHPEIFQGGNSTAAMAMAGRVSDWYFSNGKDYDGVSEQVAEVGAAALAHGRRVRFGLNGFLIARDTEAEARETLREIVAKANPDAVAGFRDAVTQAGGSTGDGKGMWADSSFEDLVQYNDGFRTKLIGTPEQIATRLVEYRRRGVDLALLGFLHYHEEVEYFGAHVLPIVRALEADADRGAGVPEPVTR